MLKNISGDVHLDKQQATLQNSLQNESKNNMSAKVVWGTLVGTLRKLNLMTLHTACGEIRDVSFNENTLCAVVSEEYLFNILTKGQNLEKISFYLKQINDKINIQFIKATKNIDVAKDNLKRLEQIFGQELEIK